MGRLKMLGGHMHFWLFEKIQKFLSSKYAGFIFASLSGILYTLANVFFKMAKNLSDSEVLMIRGIVHLFFMIPFLLVLQNDIRGPPGKRAMLWCGSAVKAICLFLTFMAFRILPFGEAIAIIFCNPVIIMLLSYFILKEPCGILKIFSVILLLVGLIFIAKPPGLIKSDSSKNSTDEYRNLRNFSDEDHIIDNKDLRSNFSIKIENNSLSELDAWPYGFIIAFGATTTLALATFAQKQVCDSTHHTVMIFSLSIAYILTASLGISFEASHGVLEHWTDILFALGYGVTSLVAQFCLILSLQLLPASLVSMLRCSEIVLAFLVQIFLFQEPYHWASLVGSAIVMVSVILITQEQIIVRTIENCWRQGTSSEKNVILNSEKKS